MQLHRPEIGAALFLGERSININFAAAARVRGPLTRERLEAALATVVRRHSMIGIRAVPESSGQPPHFETDGVPPIPLLEFDRPDDDAWVAEMSREVQVPTPYLRGPLMRCLWLRGEGVSDLVLLCDHLTADGKAAVIVLHDLLSYAADPAQAQDALPIDSPPLPDLVPPEIAEQIREDAADYPPIGPPPEDEPQDEPPGEPADEGAGPSSGIEATALPQAEPVLITPFNLTAAETSALVARCRAEGVTIQAALCAAFMTPFAEQEPAQPIRRAEIPVDLRPRLARPVGDAYGCFIGLNEIDVDCAPGRDLWDVARGAAKALAGMRDRDNFATFLVVSTLTGKFPARGWHTAYDLSISNIGRVDLPAAFGPLRVESFYGPLFAATGPTHRILDVATFDGQMTFTYSVRGREVPAAATRGLELLRSMIV